jgi:hypothetical protein
MANLHFQTEFLAPLSQVFGPQDYHQQRDRLIEMDRILIESGLESEFIKSHVEEKFPDLSESNKERQCEIAHVALRHCILLAFTQESYRDLAFRIADSELFRWFVRLGKLDGTRAYSKSTIERFSKRFDSDEVATLIHELNQTMEDENKVQQLLYQKAVLKFDKVFADCTCVKANIHFPVDWLLLRDGVESIIAAIELIRGQGLLHRMPKPISLLQEMNKLCIEMSQSRKRKNAKKARKKILRKMKKQVKRVIAHGERYLQMLIERSEETSWTAIEARVVEEKITNILEKLPKAMKLAHDRIIGERRIKNEDKILSLYEPDVHVLIRGKAGAEVEFGNGLYIAEQEDGLIVDWLFMKDQPPSDSKLVSNSVERITENYGKPESYTADRGFASSDCDCELEGLEIFNGICPRSKSKLEERLEDEKFADCQQRRASTEGRIGILNNKFFGSMLRDKGFENRELKVCWCIFTHNLWKLAGMAVANKVASEESPPHQQAA